MENPYCSCKLTRNNGVDQLASNDDYGGTPGSYIEWTAPTDGVYFVLVR